MMLISITGNGNGNLHYPLTNGSLPLILAIFLTANGPLPLPNDNGNH